ncbi:MAG: hypothetical protein A2W91_07185 [Bacteroidetes bacterium GWF2_38_335]|nr:MAG: hypothetical protein A2W91_07185 [Bacteroidetes bacterium GWF2_38_335]OFY77111.1 MAG: hypothetical protein A2281_14420 [Bacteroidetes bacterium RIFOXYA12_FULL_38_20]HBS85002.1 PIG-L family deacetylase [Bacteroidales bacterium]
MQKSEFLENKRILVVAAHPDDEVLGQGATMHKFIHEKNCLVRAIILGEGITSRSESRDTEKWKNELQLHKKNVAAAKKQIGYEKVILHDLPDNRFDSIPLLDIIKVVEKEIKDFQPEVVFTHFREDLNIDHQLTYKAVLTACRPGTSPVKSIVCFETPSATEWNAGASFLPNLYLEISEKNLRAKQKAMDCYELEKRDYPHPRSSKALRTLAEKRGIEAGLMLAEGFVIVRVIS